MNDLQLSIKKTLHVENFKGTERLILSINRNYIMESGMNGWKEFCNWLHSEIERYDFLWSSTETIDGSKIIELRKATGFTKKCTSIIRGTSCTK